MKERTVHQAAEQIENVPGPMMQADIVYVPKILMKERTVRG